ncbi:hypothetical protein DIURU_005141 [Diutina rugosa]|uniref:Telomere length regulation protein conserved domain-containing protein n=1 Tax=Diutina rugosa TaxID=5481 RepID=A0A642UEE3_DIURU|nr:uncharacterized protein DIURU_005141 [Diutina rugosa]KAA8897542.1 hypothetical protein DIURU_005141 [Diutina rugosa]
MSGDVSQIIHGQATVPQVIELIPTVWPSADEPTQLAIVKSLQSVSGLGTATTTLGLQTDPTAAYSFLSVVERLVDNLAAIPITTAAERREFDKLVWRGKVVSVVNEVCVKYSLTTSVSFANLISQLGQLQSGEDYVASVLSSDSSSLFKWGLTTTKNWQVLVSAYGRLNNVTKTRFTQSIIRYMSGSINEATASAWASILASFSPTVDVATTKLIVDVGATLPWSSARYLCAITTPFINSGLLGNLMALWSPHEFVASQRVHTCLLVYLAYNTSKEEVVQLMHSPEFVEGVSSHLSSLTPSVKQLAISLANKLSDITGVNRIFEVEGDPDIDALEPLTIDKLTIDEALVAINTTDNKVVKTSTGQTVATTTPVSGLTLSHKATTTARPRFIKDLVDYLTVDSQKKDAYEMVRTALEIGPTLIRQKPKTEVAFYAHTLFKDVVGLGNQFNDDDVVQWRLQMLIAILVKCPETVPLVVKLLAQGDYSLSQRMQMLTACSMACRELRGLDDPATTKAFTPKEFPSERLPAHIDALYQQKALADVQQQVMGHRSQQARDDVTDSALSGAGKVVRVSKRLEHQRQLQNQPKNSFSQVSNRQFFFPLSALWHAVDGRVDLGDYSAIFIGHYVTTLALVLACGFPSNDYTEATKEWFGVANDLAAQKVTDAPVVEAVATGVMVVVDSQDAEILVSLIGPELASVSQWLMSVFEGIIDERVRSVVAGALMALNEINTQFERSLANQLNGFY